MGEAGERDREGKERDQAKHVGLLDVRVSLFLKTSNAPPEFTGEHHLQLGV